MPESPLPRHSPLILTTARMILCASTPELAASELNDRSRFAELLSAEVPSDWPEASLADHLWWYCHAVQHEPAAQGWYSWYGIDRLAPRGVLVASTVFKGPPLHGSVEIGYSVLPAYQRRGYALEMVTALVDWAFRQPGVDVIHAETDDGNAPSLAFLARLGFQEIAPLEAGSRWFERRAAAR